MKFYYLREFKKDGGFNTLSICERMILSALLTSKINGDDRDLVEIIMNYDNSLDYTPYTSWQNYKDFAVIITNFLKTEKGFISDYISKNCLDVDGKGNRTLHYVSFDYSDLEIKGRHSMTKIACKAFILGCANHAVNDNNDWFEFNISQWSKTAINQRKRTLQEIDDFMTKNNINYELKGNKITIGNKRKQAKAAAVKAEKTAYNKVVEEKKEIKVEEPVEVIETKTTEVEQNSLSIENMRVIDALRLGEERKFTPAIFKRLYTENEIHGDHIKKSFDGLGEMLKREGKNVTMLLRDIVVKYNIDGAALLRTFKNLYKIVKGESLGENWKEIKDNARIEQQAFSNKMCASLTKLYDDVDVDEITYMYVVYYVAKNYGDVLNKEI